MITDMEYRLLRDRINRYHVSMQTLYPDRRGFTREMIVKIVADANCCEAPTNEDRSAVEVYQWVHNPPNNYFVYIDCIKEVATTWMGDVLGIVKFGSKWRDNFGGTRVSITVRGINNKLYYGTYYKSSGDCARIKLVKHQC